MSPLIKYQLRGFMTGTTIYIAMIFTEYLFSDLEINYNLFPVLPDLYFFLGFFILFPGTIVGMFNVAIGATLSTYDFYVVIAAVITNGIFYAIAFSFVKHISILLRD